MKLYIYIDIMYISIYIIILRKESVNHAHVLNHHSEKMKTCCGSTLTRVFGIQRERIHVFLLEEDSMTQRARRNISELSVPYRFPTHDQQNQLEVVDIMGP